MGARLHEFIAELYPICRSITGQGVRDTLDAIKKRIPLAVQEVPSGTRVFDWTVPREWNIRDGYIANLTGERIVDFRASNLHVVNYSVPVKKRVSLAELKNHLFTLPDYPEWVPYRTSYYKENWGFCLSHKTFEKLRDDEYDVCIESSLEPGHLTYGEYFIEGELADEVLICSHVCHPSLCNDNLSSIAIATFLAQQLSRLSLRDSYRFIFIPATIGSLTWLALNEHNVQRIKHGLVLAGLGDVGPSTYKKSRRGNAVIDRAAIKVLADFGTEHDIIEFFPYGYDERQFCSPGFNLPVGCFMRTPHGRYSEYHTSADNLGFVRPAALADSYAKLLRIFHVLENDRTYLSRNPKGEPQLGKRGLYRPIGGDAGTAFDELALLWVLNLSDGEHSLLDIAERSKLSFGAVKRAADALLDHSLLTEKTTTAD
jgi:aminopeptidase-like protein